MKANLTILSSFRGRHAAALREAVKPLGHLSGAAYPALAAHPATAILRQMRAHWDKQEGEVQADGYWPWIADGLVYGNASVLSVFGDAFGDYLRHADDLGCISVVHSMRCKGDILTYYIGRGRVPRTWQRQASLGNPYAVGVHGDRSEVIKAFSLDVATGTWERELEALFQAWLEGGFGPLQLACWCSPAPCHGDSIKEWLLCRQLEHRLAQA